MNYILHFKEQHPPYSAWDQSSSFTSSSQHQQLPRPTIISFIILKQDPACLNFRKSVLEKHKKLVFLKGAVIQAMEPISRNSLKSLICGSGYFPRDISISCFNLILQSGSIFRIKILIYRLFTFILQVFRFLDQFFHCF